MFQSLDLGMYLLVLVVFMTAYSVPQRAIFHPNGEFYWGVFWDLFNDAFWPIFGQYDDDTVKGETNVYLQELKDK